MGLSENNVTPLLLMVYHRFPLLIHDRKKNATTGVVFAHHFRQPHGLEPLKQFSDPPHEIPMDLWVVFPFLWVIIIPK